jgi:hypothetical protein
MQMASRYETDGPTDGTGQVLFLYKFVNTILQHCDPSIDDADIPGLSAIRLARRMPRNAPCNMESLPR